jgi:membrane-associated phospholipid phosphatase
LATPAESLEPVPVEDRSHPLAENSTYFTDGGVIPFLYVATAVGIGAELITLPHSPLAFGEEGGARAQANTIPNYQLAIMSGTLTLALATFDTPARWYHFKGMLEAIASTAALTQLAKIAVTRNRPHYDADTSTDEDDRKSFFSGHASLSAATTLYLGLYLRHHAFMRWRGDDSFAWWELPVYGGLAALAVYVPFTRVDDSKHHVSDVVVGGLVGLTTAFALFRYQDSRFYASSSARGAERISIVPWTESPGVGVVGRF